MIYIKCECQGGCHGGCYGSLGQPCAWQVRRRYPSYSIKRCLWCSKFDPVLGWIALDRLPPAPAPSPQQLQPQAAPPQQLQPRALTQQQPQATAEPAPAQTANRDAAEEPPPPGPPPPRILPTQIPPPPPSTGQNQGLVGGREVMWKRIYNPRLPDGKQYYFIKLDGTYISWHLPKGPFLEEF